MKKIMGQVTGKLSLSILTMFVLLVGVLAGLDKVTTTKASDSSKSTAAAVSTPMSSVTTAKAVKAASNLNPAAQHLQVATKDLQTVREQAKKAPLVFEPNRGQSSKGVEYFARSAGYAVFMKSAASAVLEFRQDVNTAERVTLKLNGANAQAQSQPLEATGGVSNYHIGNVPSKWLDGIPNYTKVRYNNVYPGVDVVYQGDGMNFRHDFVVQPGADPKAIRLSYEGGHGMSIDEKGRLVVALARGSFSGSRPYVYQEYNGVKHEVSGNYVLTAQNDAQFEIGSYDRSKALIIDPGYTYASYVLTAADNFETQITGVGMNSTSEVDLRLDLLSDARCGSHRRTAAGFYRFGHHGDPRGLQDVHRRNNRQYASQWMRPEHSRGDRRGGRNQLGNDLPRSRHPPHPGRHRSELQ